MRLCAIPVFAVFALALGQTSAQPAKRDTQPPRPFPAIGNDDAWAKLPPQKNTPLPEWARVLAGPLPKTTAKMLELDYLQREKNPLGPVLAARIRLEVARTLRSNYGIAIAEADLKRVVPREEEFWLGAKTSPADSLALAFAKKLTEEGHAITDKEFAELLERCGPEKVTAIVHTVAYANFHNRMLLGLGVKGESPIADPVGLKFDIDAATSPAPARPPWDDLKSVTTNGPSVRVEWGKDGFDELNTALEKQKDRKFRMPLPDPSVYDKLSPREKESSLKIRWNTISMGYQPEMTRAWFAVLYAFYDEAKVDRLFTNSVFWVVTRTNDCFY